MQASILFLLFSVVDTLLLRRVDRRTLSFKVVPVAANGVSVRQL